MSKNIVRDDKPKTPSKESMKRRLRPRDGDCPARSEGPEVNPTRKWPGILNPSQGD